MNTAVLTSEPPVPWRRDARIIGLIGLAHGTSHFFHMLLPPLFPWLIAEFAVSYSQLGLLVSLFFVVSGIGQALAGFLVDRVGARPVLYAALGCFVLSAWAAATAQGYVGLMLATLLAGLGNAPFHPADFTILNRRVSAPRLGHAFSVHGISGNLGWALAPVVLASIATLTGSWRLAAASAGVLALAVLVLLWLQREAVDDRRELGDAQSAAAHAAPAGPAPHVLAFMRLPSVWLCFSFFFWATAAFSAIQSFAAPSLVQLYALPWAQASLVVTGYMLCGAFGTAVGGFLVPRVERLERTIAACLLVSALMLVVAGTGWLPAAAALAVASLAGFGVGLSSPSRDMLIRRAAPPGATGRVYGMVYSGLDIGFAVAAPVFGVLLDAGHPSAAFYGAAAALLMGVLSASLVGANLAARKAVATIEPQAG